MNKYKINPILIHVKEKEQNTRTNYVVVLSMQNEYPYFAWNCLLVTSIFFFFEKSYENKAGKCLFFAWFGEFKVHFSKIIDVWTLLMQKAVWTEYINGIKGMNVCISPRLRLGL